MTVRVLPPSEAEEMARSWVPGIIEAALDLHRASYQYKHNTDAHIEDVLEQVAKLQMRRMCLVLNEFVMEHNIRCGTDALDAEVVDGTDDAVESDEAAAETGTDDACQAATGIVSVTPLEPAKSVTADDVANIVGLA